MIFCWENMAATVDDCYFLPFHEDKMGGSTPRWDSKSMVYPWFPNVSRVY
jgi:hypothetical protein